MISLAGWLTGFIGQIADYMLRFQLKYGFFSTYNNTLFLKQEIINGNWVLSVSNLINFNTISTPQDNNGDMLVDKVSLRECMLYFMHVCDQPDFKVVNNTHTSDWIIHRMLPDNRNYDENSPTKETRKNPGRVARFQGHGLGPGVSQRSADPYTGQNNKSKEHDAHHVLTTKNETELRRESRVYSYLDVCR